MNSLKKSLKSYQKQALFICKVNRVKANRKKLSIIMLNIHNQYQGKAIFFRLNFNISKWHVYFEILESVNMESIRRASPV